MIRVDGRVLPLSSGLLALFLGACAGGPRPGPFPPLPATFEGLDAEYRLLWRNGNLVRKGRLAAALLPPHRLRLEVLDPLGASRVVLAATEEGAILLDPTERVFRRFASGSDAFEALSGMKIPAEFLAALLVGDPGATPGWICRPMQQPGPSGKICAGPEGTPEVTLLPGGKWEVRSPGNPVLTAELKFGSGPAPGPPERIRIREEPEGLSAELVLRQVHFGSPNQDLFVLQPPSSFQEGSRDTTRSWILGGKP